ncbi:MAG: hypothetical protein IRZ02_08835, partial [Acidothermus sp.]|nr:hypothetical protein [Acidothermus sp.]
MPVSVDEARRTTPDGVPTRRSRWGVFANREFRGIALAQVTSECGDQIAGLAVAYFVYTRSSNAFLTA